jgi:hypothetical protein
MTTVVVVVLAVAVALLWRRLNAVQQSLLLLITAHNISVETVKLLAKADLENLELLAQTMTTVKADVAELSQRMEDR